MAKTDWQIEKDFVADSVTKKRTAASAAKRNRHGKGAVRFPSDYLSKEERKKLMNPAIEVKSLSRPISYEQFKALPDNDKKTQLEIWGNIYGHTTRAIASVLGVAQTTGRRILVDAGLVEFFMQRHEELGKEKRRKQRQRLKELLEGDKDCVPQAADTAFTDAPTTDIPEAENAVETILEGIPANDADKPSQNLVMQMRGNGNLVKMAIAAYLNQIDDTGAYKVQMTFTRL